MLRDPQFYQQKLMCILGEQKIYSNQVLGSDFFSGGLEQMFKDYAKVLDTSNTKVVGSFWSSWYLWFFSAYFYEMSLHDQVFDISLDNIAIQYEGKNFIFQLLNPSRTIKLGEDESREEWRKKVIRSLFANHIKPVFDETAKLTKIDQATMWGNTSSSLQYLYERMISEFEEVSIKDKLEKDLQYMIREAEAEVIGGESKNPLDIQFSYVPDPEEEGKMLRVKHRCCLHFLLHNGKGSYCYTCPTLSDEAREERRKQLQSK